nr:MAG TPA: hypothetical protein [Caudoviricetes sp.]DAW04879.1 MAG TPA: hypothetical protein [Caudoviricetes sp.]
MGISSSLKFNQMDSIYQNGRCYFYTHFRR